MKRVKLTVALSLVVITALIVMLYTPREQSVDTTQVETNKTAELLQIPPVDYYVSLDTLKSTSPYTYVSTLQESSAILNSLQAEGYTSYLEVRSADFVDVYLKKDGTLSRVIVTDGELKVFLNIEGESLYLSTYISEILEGE